MFLFFELNTPPSYTVGISGFYTLKEYKWKTPNRHENSTDKKLVIDDDTLHVYIS